MGNSMGNNDYEYTPGKVYERVQLLFKKVGLGTTQKDISNELHVSQSSVSKWKSGIPTDKLAAISKRFCVSLDWLVFGKEDDKKDFPAEPAEKPIEEYTVKDICKAFVALSNIGDVRFSVSHPLKETCHKLAPVYTICFTPKEYVKEKLNCDIGEYANTNLDIVIHYIDNRFEEIFHFFENKRNIELFFNGFADELPPRYFLATFENKLFPKELAETKTYTTLNDEIKKLPSFTTIEAIRNYQNDVLHEGNISIASSYEIQNIKMIVEPRDIYLNRLMTEPHDDNYYSEMSGEELESQKKNDK